MVVDGAGDPSSPALPLAPIHRSAWKVDSAPFISSIACSSPPIATRGLHPLWPTVPLLTADHKRSEPTSVNAVDWPA